jgi:hypothetical protein
VKRALSAVLTAVLLAGCGSDGDDDGTQAETDTADRGSPAPPADTALFEAKDVGFTFRYPKDFVLEQPEGVLGQVSLTRGAFFNAIKVRRAADRELTPDRYLDDFRRDFDRRVGEVEKRTETVGPVEAGVLSFEDEVERGGETIEFNSTSYFFAGGGGTWQVECVAEPENRDEIADACRTALESVAFTRS